MALFSATKLNINPKPSIHQTTKRRCNSLTMICSNGASDPRKMSIRAKSIKFKGTQMREQQLSDMIEQKVMEAKKVCGEDERSDECKVAWDEVEEVSQAKAHLKVRLEIDKQDPLESFCEENPETDECRIYED